MKAQSANSTFTFYRGSSTSMPIYNDHQILNGLRDLDSQVVGAVYDQLYSEVYRYILYRLGDQSLAEDLASDVFVRLIEAVQEKRGPQTNLKGWLISTASHAVADHLRRLYRRPTETISDSIQDLGPGPQTQFDMREQNDVVQQAYAQLTGEQQNVLALRFGQGYSLEDTATVMKKNVNAVKALQFRALAALQRQIGKVDYE
jgi:RNA polymerase sigma-70 factor, ECF subfamily